MIERVAFSSEGLELQGRLHPSTRRTHSAVILCHGAFESQGNWSAYAERLAANGFTSFTFDFTGHGQSAGLRNLVHLPTWAYNLRDALNALNRRGYSSFGVVGWGIGGSAAILATAHDPRLACAVVLAAPVFLQPPLPDRAAYGLAGLFARARRGVVHKPLTLSRLNELKQMQFISDDQANAAYLARPEVQTAYQAVPIPESLDSVWMDISRAVRKVKIPVRIIQGEQDRMVPPEQSQRLYDLLAGKKDLRLLPSSGHALHLDRETDAVYDLIVNWLKRYLA